MKTNKNVILGIFVFIGTLLFIVGVFYVGNKQSLFQATYSITAYFNNIDGLRPGAPVRLSGITIGSVSSISVAPDTTGRVMVVMNIQQDIQSLIRKNSKAFVETEGLVGNKIITIKKGTTNYAIIENGGIVEGVDPFAMGAVIGEVTDILAETKNMAKELSGILKKVNEGEGTLGLLLNDDALYRNTNNILITAEKGLKSAVTQIDSVAVVLTALGKGVDIVLRDADNMILSLDGLISDAKAGKGLLGKLLTSDNEFDQSVKDILDNVVLITNDVKLGAGRFAENMEALKRNWLFSSYFEQRGYYDATGYEVKLDNYIQLINERIKILDERIKYIQGIENSGSN